MVGGQVAAATSKFWQLPPLETVLLVLLMNSLPPCTARDIPIFLPITSPEVSSHHTRHYVLCNASWSNLKLGIIPDFKGYWLLCIEHRGDIRTNKEQKTDVCFMNKLNMYYYNCLRSME